MAGPRRPGGRGVIEEGIYGAIMTDADLKEASPIYGPPLSIFLYGRRFYNFIIFGSWVVDGAGRRTGGLSMDALTLKRGC